MSHPPTTQVADEMMRLLHGEPVFMAGSLAAAHAYDRQDAWSDVDVFVPNEFMLSRVITILEQNGSVPVERFDRVLYRWKKVGVRKWHTNSYRCETPNGLELNVVYKLSDGHAMTSLSQVLESFDFGLTAAGWDIESGEWMDLRPYLYPDMDIDGPLPLLPNKRDNWLQGFISQYNGLREGMRYLKYLNYGYDMSLVKQDLVTGYNQATLYHMSTFDPEKHALGEIYQRIAEAIALDDTPELEALYKVMDFNSPITEILDRLE